MYQIVMMDKINSIVRSLRVSDEANQAVDSLVETGGYKKWRVVDSAFRLITALPEDIQGKILRSKKKLTESDLLTILQDEFVRREWVKVYDSLTPAERLKVLSAADKSLSKTGGKK